MELMKKELLKYNPIELRNAANWIDRENKVYPILNILSTMHKLKELEASLSIIDNETGYIKFWLKEKQAYVTRQFVSASEMSIALSLGPVDLWWYGHLYLKTKYGRIKVDPVKINEEKNQIIIKLPDGEHRFVWLNGAEKVLANTNEGLTAGQIIINRIKV